VKPALRAALLAIPVYLVACAVPDGGLARAARFRDVHVYQGYAEQFLHGALPYRDVFVEYPPGAFAVFVPPTAFGAGHYNAAFKTLMALCGVATIVLVALVLAELGASLARIRVAVALLALSPIALGPISLNTYDAWPAFLSVAALAVLLAAWPVAAFALLGLAFAAKVYPVVLVPPALTYVWRAAGRRVSLWSVATFAAVAAAVIVPFLALSPHGLAESFRAQAARARFPTAVSSVPPASATCTSTGSSHTPCSRGRCPIETSSWSTRRARLPCSCRRRSSAMRTTTRLSRR